MKIVRYGSQIGARFGTVIDGVISDTSESLFDLESGGEIGTIEDIGLLAPVGRPDKILCIGLNYKKHAEESGGAPPPALCQASSGRGRPTGNVVTTPRTDVMYVVTEYGMVNLKGKSVPERAKALIGIARPHFRESLAREARELNLVPRAYL